MSGRPIFGRTVDRILPATGRRYDLVLALIPLSFVVGVATAVGLGVDPTLGINGGSVVALATMAYALFSEPPGHGPRRGERMGAEPGRSSV